MNTFPIPRAEMTNIRNSRDMHAVMVDKDHRMTELSS